RRAHRRSGGDELLRRLHDRDVARHGRLSPGGAGGGAGDVGLRAVRPVAPRRRRGTPARAVRARRDPGSRRSGARRGDRRETLEGVDATALSPAGRRQRRFARNASMPRLASPAANDAWCALSQNLAQARKSASVLRRAYCLFCFIAIGAYAAIVRASSVASVRSRLRGTTLTVKPASCAWRASSDSPLRTR